MTRKLGLSKLRSARTFFDFSLKRELELEDWFILKITIYWYRSKSFSASESLLWALTRDLPHNSQKAIFLVTWQGDFCHLQETADLILVRTLPVAPLWCDLGFFPNNCGNKAAAARAKPRPTELILLVDTSWHCVDTERLCAGAQQVVGGGIGTETLCVIVTIIRGNLHNLFKTWHASATAAGRCRALQVLLGSEARTRSRMTNSLRLNSAEDLYCQPLTSQYRPLQFV